MSLQKSSLCDAAVFLQQNNANVITEVSESALFYLSMVFSNNFGHYDNWGGTKKSANLTCLSSLMRIESSTKK